MYLLNQAALGPKGFDDIQMTNGPAATINEILHIVLDRPRDRLILADDIKFNHYRSEVLKFLHERYKKMAA